MFYIVPYKVCIYY